MDNHNQFYDDSLALEVFSENTFWNESKSGAECLYLLSKENVLKYEVREWRVEYLNGYEDYKQKRIRYEQVGNNLECKGVVGIIK